MMFHFKPSLYEYFRPCVNHSASISLWLAHKYLHIPLILHNSFYSNVTYFRPSALLQHPQRRFSRQMLLATKGQHYISTIPLILHNSFYSNVTYFRPSALLQHPQRRFSRQMLLATKGQHYISTLPVVCQLHYFKTIQMATRPTAKSTVI